MNINFNPLIKVSLPFFIIFVTVYILNTALYFNLPKVSIESVKSDNNEVTYRRYDFERAYDLVVKSSVKKEETKKVEVKKEYQLISNLTLKAIYSEKGNSGWIIMEESKNKESIIISTGESFKNYTLVRVYKKYVVFESGGKEYRLDLEGSKDKLKYEVVTKRDENKKWEEKIVSDGNSFKLKRNYINTYVNDFDKIWREISIKEVYKDKKIDGFKVNRIKKGTPFANLGLQKGDIIKSVNNIDLNSYNDAFKIYKQISDIDYLSIKVLRNNQIVELEYEVNN